MGIKSLVRGSLGCIGLEVRRSITHHTDPYRDTHYLLRHAPVDVIFDVGASDGSTAEDYRRLFPKAKIYSFEPTEAPFKRLTQRMNGDPNFIPTQVAIGEADGSATFHLNAFDQTNSILSVDERADDILAPGEAAQIGETSVPTVALDGFCEQHQVNTIDVLKMDVQGYELKALQGARSLLSRNAVRLIYCEVLFAPLYNGQAFFHDISGFLSGFNYQLYGLYTLMRGRNGALGWGDAIFLSPETQSHLGNHSR